MAGVSQAMPFKNETFDLIIANYSVPYFLEAEVDINQTLGEILRVLKPVGEARFFPFNANSEDLREFLWKRMKRLRETRAITFYTEPKEIGIPGMPIREKDFLVVIKKR